LSRVKSRIVHGVLVVLTLWPAAHIYLVERYDMSPWKLAGWGMYSAPRFGFLGMEIYGRRSSDEDWQKLASPTPEMRMQAGEFLERFRWLRRLAAPDALARAALETRPEWRELRVTVFYPVLDAGSGMVVLRPAAYDYP
jgi:hypothetical protein